MTRKYVDCREIPSESHCTVAISADNDEELMEAVVQHVTSVHGERDSAQLRRDLRSSMKEGAPPS